MDRYQETFQTWDKVANLYQEKFMDIDLYNDTYDIFLDLLPNQKAKLLEIGCGPGNITKYLLGKNPTLQVKGIDISPKMLELAKKNNPSAEFEVMDIREMNKIEDEFDGIISGFSLPYLSRLDCSKLINDSSVLLKNTGILYLSFVEGDYAKSGFVSGGSGGRTYFYFHELDFIRKVLIENDFINTRVLRKAYMRNDEVEETHTILITEKGLAQ